MRKKSQHGAWHIIRLFHHCKRRSTNLCIYYIIYSPFISFYVLFQGKASFAWWTSRSLNKKSCLTACCYRGMDPGKHSCRKTAFPCVSCICFRFVLWRFGAVGLRTASGLIQFIRGQSITILSGRWCCCTADPLAIATRCWYLARTHWAAGGTGWLSTRRGLTCHWFFSGRVLSDALALGGGWQNGSCHLALMLIGTVAPCALIDSFSFGWFEPRSGASWQNMATWRFFLMRARRAGMHCGLKAKLWQDSLSAQVVSHSVWNSCLFWFWPWPAAGLYLGLLKNSVPQVRCLSALQVGSVGQKHTSQLKATGCNTSYISPPRRSSQALLEHGLAPAMPLTPSADQWPLHAAARHNCLPVVQACWLCRQRCQIPACYTLVCLMHRYCWWQRRTLLLAMCVGWRLWMWLKTAGRGDSIFAKVAGHRGHQEITDKFDKLSVFDSFCESDCQTSAHSVAAGHGQLRLLFAEHLSKRVASMCSLWLKRLHDISRIASERHVAHYGTEWEPTAWSTWSAKRTVIGRCRQCME